MQNGSIPDIEVDDKIEADPVNERKINNQVNDRTGSIK
jgi:hypothetical protein